MKHLYLDKECNLLLYLLSVSLGNHVEPLHVNIDEIDWEKLDKIAREQAVVSIAYGGAVKMKESFSPELLKRWRQHLVTDMMVNERLMAAQDEVLLKLAEAQIPVVVLKGSSVARYYPQPELRRLGDIDLLVKECDVCKVKDIIGDLGYQEYESDHNFHISFLNHAGVCVEIHYQISSLPDNEGGSELADMFSLFSEEIEECSILGYTFPVLSEKNQALSIVLHMVRHMFGNGIGLRQLCDWAAYITFVDNAFFSEEILPILDSAGLIKYVQLATKTCVDYLSVQLLPVSWCIGGNEEDCRIFLEDILHCGNMGRADKGRINNFLVKYEFGEKNKHSYVSNLISLLSKRAIYLFPITKKYPFILPVFWIYLPVRYLIRSISGKRPKLSIEEIKNYSSRRKKLYEKVKPFIGDK